MTRDWKFYPENVHGHRIKSSHGYRSAVSAQIDEKCFPQENIKKSTVFDLVYRYLHKCADRERKLRRRNCACSKFYKQHARKRNIHEAASMPGTKLKEIFYEQFKPNKSVLYKRMSRSSSKEYIADYTKAVRDGRKRVKQYVQEALLYGLQSGLLHPIDRHRNILCVSQKLGVFPPKNAKDLYHNH